MNFQLKVVIIALIILILMFTFVGYVLFNNRTNKEFPPVSGECPDYWIAKNNQCINPKSLGNCNGPKNFDTQEYKGHNGDCLKSHWAKNCGLSWQGITNNPDVCLNKGT